jgi:hypothetical protein
MINWYFAVSGMIFTYFLVRWSTRGWLNIVVKIGLFAMTMWSTFLNLHALGWIVKSPIG